MTGAKGWVWLGFWGGDYVGQSHCCHPGRSEAETRDPLIVLYKWRSGSRISAVRFPG